jgi:hypothetical protein
MSEVITHQSIARIPRATRPKQILLSKPAEYNSRHSLCQCIPHVHNMSMFSPHMVIRCFDVRYKLNLNFPHLHPTHLHPNACPRILLICANLTKTAMRVHFSKASHPPLPKRSISVVRITPKGFVWAPEALKRTSEDATSL